jgi:hypothetical protein
MGSNSRRKKKEYAKAIVIPVPPTGDLKETLEALADFRKFWQDNVTQAHPGANHHNPMWTRIADILDKHRMNNATNYYISPVTGQRPNGI